jgi:hypothetical protein
MTKYRRGKNNLLTLIELVWTNSISKGEVGFGSWRAVDARRFSLRPIPHDDDTLTVTTLRMADVNQPLRAHLGSKAPGFVEKGIPRRQGSTSKVLTLDPLG